MGKRTDIPYTLCRTKHNRHYCSRQSSETCVTTIKYDCKVNISRTLFIKKKNKIKKSGIGKF